MINLKEKFKNSKYKKEITYIAIGLFLIAIFHIVSFTHAFYNSQSNPIPIFNTKVGDFTGEGESVKDGPLTNKNTDVNIIFYTQMPDNPNKYMVSKYLPVNGYKVNEKASNCYPATGGDATYNNNYNIDSEGNLNITYTETKPTQVVCRIYYDRDKLSDVIIYAYLEDTSGDKKYNDKTYRLVNQVESNYTLVAHECKNNKATFSYDNTTGFEITSSGPDTCYAYFRKS